MIKDATTVFIISILTISVTCPVLFCSTQCAATGCIGWTANDCNGNCRTAMGWTSIGASCAIDLSEKAVLDFSGDVGGTFAVTPISSTPDCTNFIGITLQTYGSYTANTILTFTKAGGTSIPHWGLDLLYGLIAIDSDGPNSWSPSTHIFTNLNGASPPQNKSYTLSSANMAAGINAYCGITTKYDAYFHVTNTYVHNLTNVTISFSVSTDSSISAAIFVVKQILLILKLCNVGCLSCYNEGTGIMCTSCDPSIPYLLNNNTCNRTCIVGFGYTNYVNLCVWCNPSCSTCYGIANNCTTCHSTAYLFSNQTVKYSTCFYICPSGYFGNNTTQTCDYYGCQYGYWMITRQCTNIVGCIATRIVNQQVVCLACNVIQRYRLTNYACECVSGFYLARNSQCLEICGDGRVYGLQCDDNNMVNGDGCSSTCQIEKHYICLNGSQTHQSDCVYKGRDFSLTLKWIDKVDGENQGIFAFTVYPSFASLDKLNLMSNLKFNCDQSSQFIGFKYNLGLLLLYVNYKQNLQGNSANITIHFDSNFIIQKNFFLPFSMISNGDKLIIVNDYNKMTILINIIVVMPFFVLFIFVVGSLTHKMVGVEILHCFQIICLLRVLSNNSTPIFGLLRYFSIVTGNFLYLSNAQTNIYNSKQAIHYNHINQNFSEGIFLGVSILFILCCIVPLICKWKQNCDGSQKDLNKHSQVNSYVKFVYTHLVFPIVIASFMLNLLAITTIIDRQLNPIFFAINIQFTSFLSLCSVFISSFIFFFELKLVFTQKNDQMYLQGLSQCNNSYIPAYLTYIFFLNILIIVCYKHNFAYSIEIITVVIFIFLIYVIFIKNYKSNLHKAGQIMNILTVFFFVSWMLARQFSASITSEQNQFFAMFLLCCLMTTCLIITCVRIIIQLKTKCSVKQTKQSLFGNQNSKVKDKLQQNQRYNNQLTQRFHLFNPFYGSIIKKTEEQQHMHEVNRQRLLKGGECLYTNKDRENKIMRLPNIYRKPIKIGRLKQSQNDKQIKSKLPISGPINQIGDK